MHAGQADLLLALDQLAERLVRGRCRAQDPLDHHVRPNEKQALEEYLRLKALVDRQTLVISEVRDRTAARVEERE